MFCLHQTGSINVCIKYNGSILYLTVCLFQHDIFHFTIQILNTIRLTNENQNIFYNLSMNTLSPSTQIVLDKQKSNYKHN